MTYKLIVAKPAAVAFGKAVVKGAETRRDFCIRMVEEVLLAPLQIEAIFEASKEAANYADFEESDAALFRKQLSYVRQIAAGWDKLAEEVRESFTGGALPASSVVKVLKEPETKAASKPVAEAVAQDRVQAQAQAAPQVISPGEMMLHLASHLDQRQLADFSEAEAKAYGQLRDAMKAIEARFTKAASRTLKAA